MRKEFQKIIYSIKRDKSLKFRLGLLEIIVVIIIIIALIRVWCDMDKMLIFASVLLVIYILASIKRVMDKLEEAERKIRSQIDSIKKYNLDKNEIISQLEFRSVMSYLSELIEGQSSLTLGIIVFIVLRKSDIIEISAEIYVSEIISIISLSCFILVSAALIIKYAICDKSVVLFNTFS